MPVGESLKIETPNPDVYHHDCLHPCIRYISNGFLGHKWWMIQSPYYGRNSNIENPILYYSSDNKFPKNWECKAIIRGTPETGYNSDPGIFFENNKLWIYWRECDTPLCKKLDCVSATVGFSTEDVVHYGDLKIFLTEKNKNIDSQLCPILIKKDERYLFYASNYHLSEPRINKGVAVWIGSSLDNPDFILNDIVPFKLVYTCDKYKQLRIWEQYLFFPKPLKHDLWHFDLFEYQNRLYMISVAEWGDNIMLSVSEDYLHFKTFQTPLINCHYSQQFYFYKPTGFIKEDVVHLYYTARSKKDKKQNELFHSQITLSEVI